MADIVGTNSTAAVAFNDTKAANEILDSLQAKEHIVSAILVLPDGTIFAYYGRHADAPVIETADRFVFREADALMIKPVMLEGKQVATLNIVSDYRAVYAGLRKLVGWMLLLVVVVGVGVAVLLSNWLQRFISDPVLRLTRTAQTVADNHDYSVRAPEESGVELGLLTRTFNQMLARIQEQDEALTLSQHKLEALINSIDGIVWECEPDTFHFTFVSRQCERLLGYTPDTSGWPTPRFWQDTPASGRCRQGHPDLPRLRRRAPSPIATNTACSPPMARVVWIRESGSVLVEHGQAVAMRGIFQDITAQKNGRRRAGPAQPPPARNLAPGRHGRGGHRRPAQRRQRAQQRQRVRHARRRPVEAIQGHESAPRHDHAARAKRPPRRVPDRRPQRQAPARISRHGLRPARPASRPKCSARWPC